MNGSFFARIAYVITALLLVCSGSAARAAADVEVGRNCQQADRPSLDQVDHSAYDALLRRYVDDRGLVAYAQWKASAVDLQGLTTYLESLGCVDLRKPAKREARLAFWINAYNALTLYGILREYPTTSIRNHTAKFVGYNIWKNLLVWVDGRKYALDDIEHSILRKLGEPRIHLAVVCASIGCPPLDNRAYTAGELDQQLTENGRRFLSRPANFRADAGTRTVHISKLFEWYGTDFAATPAAQLQALRPMLPDGTEWATQAGVRVDYLDYDWNLNDQRPVGS